MLLILYNEMNMDVFSYTDYQAFLREYYEERKKKDFFFSFRLFGTKTGVDPSYLVRVMQGRAHISLKSLPGVCRYMGLEGKSREYFEAMIRFAKARTNQDSKLWFERMLELQGIDADTVEASQYEYYRKWYHSAVRALISIEPFRGEYKALAGRLSPSISVKEAKDSVELLFKLGLVRRETDGSICVCQKHLTTGQKWNGVAVREFQKECIRIASESIDRHPKEIRDISTLTLAVHHKDLILMREKASEFRRSLQNLASDVDGADCVYQVNVQIVPLSTVPGESGT